jgi:hypothetical protein
VPESSTALRGGLKQTYLVLQIGGLSAVTLISDQLRNRTIEFQGLLTANCVVTFQVSAFEDSGLSWIVLNSTTGNFTLQILGPQGVGYNIPQGRRTGILWDGSNIVPTEFGAVVRSDETIVSGITGNSPTVVLTTQQANASVITLQGNATGSPVIQMPNGFALFVVNNQLGVGVTVKTAGGNPTGAIAGSTNKWCFIDNNPNGGNANTV